MAKLQNFDVILFLPLKFHFYRGIPFHVTVVSLDITGKNSKTQFWVYFLGHYKTEIGQKSVERDCEFPEFPEIYNHALYKNGQLLYFILVN
jgi:hypothetical protein